MSTFSDQEKYECAVREVTQRQRVYPRLVREGKMTQEKADLEIRKMLEIASDYRAKTGLFAGGR